MGGEALLEQAIVNKPRPTALACTSAIRYRLVRPDMADEEVQLLTSRLTPGLGGYLVLIIAGLYAPIIAVIGYLGVALYYIVPFRRNFVPPPATAPPQP
ncbi:MAG: hypothetical protein J2P30_00635 [Actinobacteria bacterium]|nr:hypothetical protein [Actinomycetota bacterium]